MRFDFWRRPPRPAQGGGPLWLEVEAQQAWQAWDQDRALIWQGVPILTLDGQGAACPPCAYAVIARWWLDRAAALPACPSSRPR